MKGIKPAVVCGYSADSGSAFEEDGGYFKREVFFLSLTQFPHMSHPILPIGVYHWHHFSNGRNARAIASGIAPSCLGTWISLPSSRRRRATMRSSSGMGSRLFSPTTHFSHLSHPILPTSHRFFIFYSSSRSATMPSTPFTTPERSWWRILTR